MNEWALIIGMMLVTFLPRYVPLALAGRVHLPDWLRQALEFVPIAVLTAIVVQVVWVRPDGLDANWDNPYLWAVVVASIAAWLKRSLLQVIAIGLAVYAVMLAI